MVEIVSVSPVGLDQFMPNAPATYLYHLKGNKHERQGDNLLFVIDTVVNGGTG